MPSLTVNKLKLFSELNRSFTDVEFEDLVFSFGLELDEIHVEDGVQSYKLDIPANRYDLLCQEGLVLALTSFLNKKPYDGYTLKASSFKVYKHFSPTRPFIACAVIRNVGFNKEKYKSFISYQDKLHLTIGRNRALASIGTHDLDKIKHPIEYGSLNPEMINFVPLNCETVANGRDIEQFLDKRVKRYLQIIKSDEKYVVFRDKEGVLSLPPIINSERSKITLDTKNIFVEVTGTNFFRVNTSLKLILACFSGETVETVEIVDVTSSCRENCDFETSVSPGAKNSIGNNGSCSDESSAGAANGLSTADPKNSANEAKLSALSLSCTRSSSIVTPVFYNAKFRLDYKKINQELKIALTADQICLFLVQMMHTIKACDTYVDVFVPDVRSDVLHTCDLLEDIAIAYGYKKFIPNLPEIFTVGEEEKLNKFGDKVRLELAIAGYNEALTLTLLSKNENIFDNEQAVVLENPKSLECEVVRTSLLPGLLKSVSSNLSSKIPFRVFEVADICLSTSNVRYCCAVYASTSAAFEEIHGLLSHLIGKCGLVFTLERRELDRYLENQSAVIKIGGVVCGNLGVLNPKICVTFKVPYAASSFELDIEKVFEAFNRKELAHTI